MLAALSFCGSALGQKVAFSLVRPGVQPVPMVRSIQPETITETPSHRFWDRENSILFATRGAFSAADFILTRNNLRNHGQELDPVTHLLAWQHGGSCREFRRGDGGCRGTQLSVSQNRTSQVGADGLDSTHRKLSSSDFIRRRSPLKLWPLQWAAERGVRQEFICLNVARILLASG
jgi:hypothetical protein